MKTMTPDLWLSPRRRRAWNPHTLTWESEDDEPKDKPPRAKQPAPMRTPDPWRDYHVGSDATRAQNEPAPEEWRGYYVNAMAPHWGEAD